MRRITNVRTKPGFLLELSFDDGVTGTANVADLAGKGVFSLWRDHQAFEQVMIGRSGELIWSDQVELCPDALYLKVTHLAPEDLFPALRGETVHA